MATTKPKVIKSFEKLTPELLDLLAQQYPNGYTEQIMMIPVAGGKFMKALPLETDKFSYLIKFPVEETIEMDNDDMDNDGGGEDELNLEGGEDVEEEEEKDEVEKPTDNFDDIDVADETAEP